MERLYSWLAKDDLLSCEPVLRAAVLYWALSGLPIRGVACMGIDAVVAHELRAGRIDWHLLFVIGEYEPGEEALAMRRGINQCGDQGRGERRCDWRSGAFRWRRVAGARGVRGTAAAAP